MSYDPIEKIGGSSRFITLITIVIHFLHPLLCIANYLDWVRHQDSADRLGSNLVRAYLAMSILSAIFFLLVSSVFYMWAWRYPEPEEIAKRRRIYGIIGNLLISDFPIFMVEVQIVWSVQFAAAIQGLAFIFTCISFLYSGFRVWTFIVVKVIKHQAPVVGAQGAMTGARGFDGPIQGSPRSMGGGFSPNHGRSLGSPHSQQQQGGWYPPEEMSSPYRGGSRAGGIVHPNNDGGNW